MAGNDIDRIIKENFVLHLLDVFKVLLNIQDCEIDNGIHLPGGKLQGTVEREPDFVKVMKRPGGARFILHIEFQTTNEADMLYRIQEYHALLQRRVKLPIKHYVVYLGKRKPTMPTSLGGEMVFEGFELKNIGDYHAATLLESSVPEEVVMAVLGNFAGVKPVEVVRKVLERLQKISPNRTKLKKYLYQLTVLSRLRNLDREIIKQSANMGIAIDIEKDFLYRKGIEKGIEKEKLQNAKKLKQLGVSTDIIAKSTGLTVEQIKSL